MWATLLLIAAFVVALLAALGVSAGRYNLVALSLACWVASVLAASYLH